MLNQPLTQDEVRVAELMLRIRNTLGYSLDDFAALIECPVEALRSYEAKRTPWTTDRVRTARERMFVDDQVKETLASRLRGPASALSAQVLTNLSDRERAKLRIALGENE